MKLLAIFLIIGVPLYLYLGFLIWLAAGLDKPRLIVVWLPMMIRRLFW